LCRGGTIFQEFVYIQVYETAVASYVHYGNFSRLTEA
jgi:hypothetical protein